MRLGLAVTLSMVAWMAGCVAPMARTSQMAPGLHLEAGAGATAYRGAVVPETIRLRDTVLNLHPCVGAEAHARLGYNFGRRFGIDYTQAFLYGTPVDTAARWQTWGGTWLAAKCRPWNSNDLLLLELGGDELAGWFGWVHGFPSSGQERLSVMLMVGSTVPEATYFGIVSGELPRLLARYLLPSRLEGTLAYNTRHGRHRISPNLGATLTWDWNSKEFFWWAVQAGVAFGYRAYALPE